MQRVQVVECSPPSPKLMAPQCSLIPWMEGAIPLTWSMGHQEWSASSPSTTQSVLGPVDLASQMSLKFIYFLSALPTAFTNLPSSVTVEHCLAHGWGPIYRSVFFLIYLNWRIIALQYCIGFCHTSTWIRHRHTYVPFELLASYGQFPLGICFTHGSVYVSMLFFLFLLNNWISWVQSILDDSR